MSKSLYRRAQPLCLRAPEGELGCELGMPSEQHKSASNKHGHHVEHSTRRARVGCGTGPRRCEKKSKMVSRLAHSSGWSAHDTSGRPECPEPNRRVSKAHAGRRETGTGLDCGTKSACDQPCAPKHGTRVAWDACGCGGGNRGGRVSERVREGVVCVCVSERVRE